MYNLLQGKLIIIMEYIDGFTLRDLLVQLNSESTKVKTLLEYAKQIANGMEYIHSKEVMHGDLQYENKEKRE